MKNLFNKLQKYSIQDALNIEQSDRQYIALRKLFENIQDRQIYLSIILANSIVCYQLSWKWEDYWEEFSEYFIKNIFKKINLIIDLSEFIKQSKNNRRFIDIKIKRLNKLKFFLENFDKKQEYYYGNLQKLRDVLAKTMNQKSTAKTIVFAIKMFSYWARNYFDKLNYFPKNINIPIDSRLKNLFEKYKWNYTDIDIFYKHLSEKLNIPQLHLDAIIWVKYDEFI